MYCVGHKNKELYATRGAFQGVLNVRTDAGQLQCSAGYVLATNNEGDDLIGDRPLRART